MEVKPRDETRYAGQKRQLGIGFGHYGLIGGRLRDW